MLSFIKRLFADPTAHWPRSFADPILGTLRLSVDPIWWEVEVPIGDRSIGFKVAGEGRPDPLLLAHAHDIVQFFDRFERTIADYLGREAQAITPYGDEIRQLVVNDVCLLWPDRPDDGMIYFKGSGEYRLWRCDYINGAPMSPLGCDT